MKPCKHCSAIKSLTEFYKHPQMADGHLNVCKPCRDTYVKAWNERNRERRLAIQREHATKTRTPEKSAAAWARWYGKTYADPAGRARILSRVARRNAVEVRAQPSWANEAAMEDAYYVARRLSEFSGRPWDVDHIVPLQAELVCGLHVESNLRAIPATVNRSKRNFHWPDMPA